MRIMGMIGLGFALCLLGLVGMLIILRQESSTATFIAFSSNQEGNWEIYTMRADGSDMQRLTYDNAEDSTPSWSPNGQRLAFTSNRRGNWEIYTMRTDGSDVQRLTHNT